MHHPAVFQQWTTPLIADACQRLTVPIRISPMGLRAIRVGLRLQGPVRPVRHYGSVDVFLESIMQGNTGDVLVIDNGGRCDESCIGDLTVLEAKAAGFAGIVLWGAHRDTAEIMTIDLPVFSYGTLPSGPQRLDPRDPEAFTTAQFGQHFVTANDYVFADDDGAVFVPQNRLDQILLTASNIWNTERHQAEAVQAGLLLREQLQLEDYINRRACHPSLTFRQYLREISGAIEQ